jgi:anti-sigma regulatory factor (Ser/Thr protein kinase)
MFVTLPPDLDKSYLAEAKSVPLARSAVTRLAARHGMTGDSLDAVRLAVTEAVTNAVRHAYRDRAGLVHLMAVVTGGELWVLVADDGCGHRTPAAQPGLGLGLTVIAQHSDTYVITERATGGTEVRMRFPIWSASAPSDR